MWVSAGTAQNLATISPNVKSVMSVKGTLVGIRLATSSLGTAYDSIYYEFYFKIKYTASTVSISTPQVEAMVDDLTNMSPSSFGVVVSGTTVQLQISQPLNLNMMWNLTLQTSGLQTS